MGAPLLSVCRPPSFTVAAISITMLGPGRSQLSKGLLRQLNKARNVRHLSNLAQVTSRQVAVQSNPGNSSLVFQPPVLSRSLYTSQVLREVTVVVCPAFADSISEGDIRWEKAVGDSVSEDEVLCEIETDKTSVPVPSPGSGVIEALHVEDGSTVQPGTKLLTLKLGPGGPKPAAPMSARPPPPPMPAKKAPAPGASPVIRMPPSDPTTEIAGTRSEHRVKLNRMRLKIASRLKDAQNTNAMLTTFNELDMSAIMQLRKENQEGFVKKHGIKMGFMSAFVKASAYALTKQPTVNAVIDGGDTVYRDYVDISVAVASPKGLVVPVLRNVERMNYADIEKGIATLGQKARNNQISIEDMDGGTFTISNGGVFGSLFGTPIINPPQSAILGVHGVFERPVVRNGQVVIRPMMYIALTYDHRLVDGREAVTFLRTIKKAVEDPRVMFLDL